jgi:hypothetical protein
MVLRFKGRNHVEKNPHIACVLIPGKSNHGIDSSAVDRFGRKLDSIRTRLLTLRTRANHGVVSNLAEIQR